MKLKYSNLIIGMLLFIIIVLTSCNNNIDIKNIDDVQKKETIEDFFLTAVKKNPIDSLFEKEFDEGNKTYTEIVNNYTLMWINEFNYTKRQCDKFIKNEEEKSRLITLLDEWDKNEQSTWQLEVRTIFCENRGIYGTQVYDEEWKKVGDRYREKTLWLKYSYFIIETGLDPSLFSNELKSIEFEKTENQEYDLLKSDAVLYINSTSSMTEQVSIFFDKEEEYVNAMLPFTEFLKNVGMSVEWIDNNKAIIIDQNHRYILNLLDASFCRENSDFNLINMLDGGRTYYIIKEKEILVDSVTVTVALSEIGIRAIFDIDETERTIYADVKRK